MPTLSTRQKARVKAGFASECFEARYRAIQNSAEYGLTQNLPIITRILQEDLDFELQLAAIMAIGKLGNDSHIPMLEDIGRDTPFDDFRQAIEISISQIRTKALQ